MHYQRLADKGISRFLHYQRLADKGISGFLHYQRLADKGIFKILHCLISQSSWILKFYIAPSRKSVESPESALPDFDKGEAFWNSALSFSHKQEGS